MTPLHPIADKREARVEVIQADRDMAADELRAFYCARSDLAEAVRTDTPENNNHRLVQAFARHRATAEQQRISDSNLQKTQSDPTLSKNETVAAAGEDARLFDLLEAIADAVDQRGDGTSANEIRAGFARGTGGVSFDYLVPLIADALISSPVAPDGEGWRDLSSAPYAMHVLACRFDQDGGEWIVSVVSSPPSKPFTHWRPLPAMPATHTGITPEEIG